MMSFQEALDVQKEFNAQVDRMSAILNDKYPEKGPMGLTPEHIRLSREYQADKAAFDNSFKYLRSINGFLNKHYKKEYSKHSITERDARRAKALAACNNS